MGIISKGAKVRLWGKNIKPLLEMGYNGKKGDIIDVSIEHLSKDSKVLIDVQCDYCGCIKTITFSHYNKCKHSNNLYACTHCVGNKVIETNIERYGVPSTTMLREVKDKMVTTNIERYGVINAFQSKECKEKIKQTMNQKYGVDRILQSEYGKEKVKNTCIEKYGVDNPAKSQEIKDKMANTNIERYGGIAPSHSLEVREKMKETYVEKYNCINPSQSPEVRAKIAQTLYKNGTTPTSKQQLYIFNLYKSINSTTELNYPISHYYA